jgi:hypothetical protein
MESHISSKFHVIIYLKLKMCNILSEMMKNVAGPRQSVTQYILLYYGW